MSSETSEGRDTGCKCVSFRKDKKNKIKTDEIAPYSALPAVISPFS